MITLWWVRLLIVAVISTALVVGYSWFVNHQQKIGYDQRTAEYVLQENQDLKAALAETARLNHIIEKAQDEAKQREETNRVLSLRNASLLGKLRNADARINELVSSASADALRDATRAYAGLFAECRTDFEALGRSAAGHLNDVRTLQASWPVKP